MNAYPKAIAITYCTPCRLVTFADHVDQEDAIPHRFCSHCGKRLGVALYEHVRELRSSRGTSNRPPALPPAGE